MSGEAVSFSPLASHYSLKAKAGHFSSPASEDTGWKPEVKNAFSKQLQGVIKKIFVIRVLGLLIGNGPGF